MRRAFQLGYAKTLGTCAPKPAGAAAVAPVARRDVCTRRELDEPLLHYGFRRVASAFSSMTPIDAAERRVDEVRTHIDYLDDLLADIRHAITGSPHAAHHLWVNLPDPHRGSWHEWFTGAPRCSMRFASLPLWPSWHDGDQALIVEHVLGQLLFATRFGTTASCNDYTIHWDAPADACARLATDPAKFLADQGALASVRAVLDRRRRQLQLVDLARALGRRAPALPPDVATIVSLQCFTVGHATAVTGKTVRLADDDVGLREIGVAAVRPTGDGPLDVYVALATLLAGVDTSIVDEPAPLRPADLDGPGFMLARLDRLSDADPFRGTRWPLDHPELVEIYPFEHHLHKFVDAFRRRYLAQRGRL